MTVTRALNHECPTRVVEWGLGFILVTWCIILILWPRLLQNSDLPAYSYWRDIMSQATWALFGLTVGVTRLCALYINGARRRSPYFRLATSFLSMGFWFLVTVGVLRSGMPTTALAVYPWFMVGDAYASYVSSGDSYKAWVSRRTNKRWV